MTATRLHSRSASSMACVTSTTVVPRCPDCLDQPPGHVPGRRIQARGHLVEEHDLRVVDQCQRDEQALPLAAGQLGEARVPLPG